MKQWNLLIVCMLTLALGWIAGCRKDPAANGVEEKVVNVLVFSEYLPKDVLDDFTRESGIKVNVVNFSNNEELREKLQSTDFDVVSPSDYAVRRLADEGLLRKLDREKLPNVKNLDPTLLGKPYDKSNAYALPLFWGTTGIGYNKAKLGAIDSWAAMFDTKHSGQILMLNDGRELLVAALRKLGRDPSKIDNDAFDAALSELRKQKDLVKIYDSDTFYAKLSAGDVALAQGFSGQFAKVVKEKPSELAYVIPREGGTLWIDNLAVTTKGKHPGNAHVLMDYLMRPDVAAKVANFAGYASPNLAAKPKIDAELLNDPVIYPPADVLARCVSMEPIDAAMSRKIEALINEVKK